MSKLQSLTELQRFGGIVTYLGKFILSLAEVIIPLRAHLKEDVGLNLENPLLNATEKLKTFITSAPILKIFDPNLPLRLKIDSSPEGLGALLEQNPWFVIKNNNMHKLKKGLISFWSRTFPRIFICL